MRIGSLDVVRSFLGAWRWTQVVAGAKAALHWISVHTGVPVLIVAALVVCVGYRVLKRSLRFVIEVTAVIVLLLLATELGWIRW